MFFTNRFRKLELVSTRTDAKTSRIVQNGRLGSQKLRNRVFYNMFEKLRSLFLSAITTSVLVTTSISDGISEKSKICFRTFVVQNFFYQVGKFHLRNFFLTGMASVSVESFRAISRKSSFLICNNF